MKVTIPKIDGKNLNGRFAPFYTKFPEIAAKENQTLELIFADKTKEEYLLIENYCEDYNCDCRKAMINIVNKKDHNRILATIGFGWESLEFYKKWAHGDEWLAKEMLGAYLELGGIQSEDAVYLLEEFKKSINSDNVEILKRHYSMFKKPAN